jgi:hypothetical protein
MTYKGSMFYGGVASMSASFAVAIGQILFQGWLLAHHPIAMKIAWGFAALAFIAGAMAIRSKAKFEVSPSPTMKAEIKEDGKIVQGGK